jgi:peptide chain release factor 2
MKLSNKDLKIESYPKVSQKGMAIQTAPKGVKITHVPTGIAVKCDLQRSQHGNRQIALEQLENIVAEYKKKY